LKLSDKLRNYAVYISRVIHIPAHIAVPRCTLPLVKAYLKGLTFKATYRGHIGPHLHKNCIVRTYGKYFIVRKHTVDLNVVTPLSETEEINILCSKLKNLKERAKRNSYQIIFIDVGAHIGKYSILFSNLVHKVIALEPDPRNYIVLRYNLKLNKVFNVVALHMASSSQKGRIKLVINNVYTAHSHVVNQEKPSTHYIMVQALPLDSLLEQLGLTSATTYYVLKVDVEGHEVDVLKGAQRTLRRTKILLVETTYQNLHQLLKLLPREMYVVAMRRYPQTMNLVLTTRELVT